MNPTKQVFLIVSLTAALAASVLAHGDKEKGKEEKVEWSSVPAAVQATITSNAAGGQVVSVEKEIEKDATEYEAKVKGADGKMTEIKVSADGKLLKVEAENEHGDHHGKDKDDDDDKD